MGWRPPHSRPARPRRTRWALASLLPLALAGPLAAQESPTAEEVGPAADPLPVAQPVSEPEPPEGEEGAPPSGPAPRGPARPTQPFAPAPPRPRQGFLLAPWLTLSPAFSSGAFYLSNARRTEEDPEEALELVQTLSLDLLARGRTWEAGAGYVLSDRRFVGASDLDAVEHRGRAHVLLRGRRNTLEVKGSTGYLERPQDPALNLGKARRLSSDLLATWTLRATSRLGLFSEVRAYHIDYGDQSVDTDQAGLGLQTFLSIYRVGPGAVLIGGGYREVRYTDTELVRPDLGFTSALAGYRVERRTLTASVRLGYELGHVVERRAFPRGSSPPSGLVAYASLDWRLGARGRLGLDASRNIELSTIDSSRTATRVRVSGSWALGYDLSPFASLTYLLQEPEDGFDLLSLGATAGLNWSPRPWLRFTAQASVQRVRRRGGGDFDLVRAGVFVSLLP